MSIVLSDKKDRSQNSPDTSRSMTPTRESGIKSTSFQCTKCSKEHTGGNSKGHCHACAQSMSGFVSDDGIKLASKDKKGLPY